MKIMFLISQVYKHGGIEKVLVDKANYLAQKNFTVTIVTFEQCGHPPIYDLDATIDTIDLGVNYNRSIPLLHPVNFAKAFIHFYRLRQLLYQIAPDFVVNCSYSYDFYLLPFIHRKSRKIKEYHASRAVVAPGSIRLKVDRFIESFYDTIILLNPSETKYYRNANIVVVPNAVHVPELTSKLENKKAIAVGRIAPVKNFDFLIEVWEELITHNDSWELHIYGEDYLGTKNRLQEKITSRSLQDHIKFMGSTDNIFETLKEYSITLMSSHTECFPMILLESLAVGVPIISVDCPTGPRHIIENNSTGYLVPVNRKDAMVEKILELMENAGLRRIFGRNAKKSASKYFIENVMNDWVKNVLSETKASH